MLVSANRVDIEKRVREKERGERAVERGGEGEKDITVCDAPTVDTYTYSHLCVLYTS